MNDLEIFQQTWKALSDRIVYNNRTKTSADYEDNRFICSEFAEIHCCDFIA